jgi:hypothetical protein
VPGHHWEEDLRRHEKGWLLEEVILRYEKNKIIHALNDFVTDSERRTKSAMRRYQRKMMMGRERTEPNKTKVPPSRADLSMSLGRFLRNVMNTLN